MLGGTDTLEYSGKFKREETWNGRQQLNISKLEKEGLDSLQKRVKEGELVIMKTDKSGKLVPIDRDVYVEMGKAHTSGDEEITMAEVLKMSEDIDNHSSAYLRMFNMGEAWGHQKRLRRSFLGGQAPSPMYLLIKDHKKWDPEGPPKQIKTRPVV